MRRGRTIGLDLGRARIGVAIDDELGSMAHPRGTLDASNRVKMLEQLGALAEAEGVTRIVVGLPLDMKGGEGEAARGARAMAQVIADATGLLVELWDERMTTQVASRALASSEVRGKKAREHIDEASAVAILQSWLEDAARSRRGGRG
jgi:putative Holliday junction resolvase